MSKVGTQVVEGKEVHIDMCSYPSDRNFSATFISRKEPRDIVWISQPSVRMITTTVRVLLVLLYWCNFLQSLFFSESLELVTTCFLIRIWVNCMAILWNFAMWVVYLGFRKILKHFSKSWTKCYWSTFWCDHFSICILGWKLESESLIGFNSRCSLDR